MSELISSSCYESVIHTQQHRRSRFLFCKSLNLLANAGVHYILLVKELHGLFCK